MTRFQEELFRKLLQEMLPRQIMSLNESLTSKEIVTVGYYDFTTFGVPANAKIKQFTVTVTNPAVVSVHGFTTTLGSGSTTVTTAANTYISPATVIDVSAISGGEVSLAVQYYI